jgi:hypothetical protein
MGMVEGVSQMFQLLNEAQAAGTVQLDPLLCTSYGETFPELTDRSFTVLAMSAMRVAWPCKK